MEQFTTIASQIIYHEFFMAFYGILLWYGLVFKYEHKKKPSLKFKVWYPGK